MTEDGNPSITRREAIRKTVVGGAVAGVVWSAPRVEGLSLRPDYAAASSSGDLRETFTFTFNSPGRQDAERPFGNGNLKVTIRTRFSVVVGDPLSSSFGFADITSTYNGDRFTAPGFSSGSANPIQWQSNGTPAGYMLSEQGGPGTMPAPSVFTYTAICI